MLYMNYLPAHPQKPLLVCCPLLKEQYLSPCTRLPPRWWAATSRMCGVIWGMEELITMQAQAAVGSSVGLSGDIWERKTFVWMWGIPADGSAHGSFPPRHAESMEFFTLGSCGFTPQGMSLTWFGKKVRMGNWWVGFIKLIGGKTAFCSAAPTIWNSLSLSLYLIDSQSDFKSQLKTSLFSCALYPVIFRSCYYFLFISNMFSDGA